MKKQGRAFMDGEFVCSSPPGSTQEVHVSDFWVVVYKETSIKLPYYGYMLNNRGSF